MIRKNLWDVLVSIHKLSVFYIGSLIHEAPTFKGA